MFPNRSLVKASNGSWNKQAFERNTIAYGTIPTSSSLIDQNSSTVSTDFGINGTNWATKKSIYLGGKTVSEVRNEIRNASTSSLWITESAIKYIYQNGNYSISSVESHHSNQYTLKTYPNPFIFHPVERIEVSSPIHGGNDKEPTSKTLRFSGSNTTPTDLNSTAPLTIPENQPIGSIVGEFNATDPDVNATLSIPCIRCG